MLIDTHCHINTMVKPSFDTKLTELEIRNAQLIIDEAEKQGVTQILNVGTSLIESANCITLAEKFSSVYAAIGIHPNDLTQTWKDDLKKLGSFLENRPNKIVAIGECGIDKHYPEYNIPQQQDAFKAQIELALAHDLALIVHTRDAPDETLRCLEEYKNQGLRGTIHCFSEDLSFAQETLSMGFVLGIGGTVTYPKNDRLRDVVRSVGIEQIILETDAPFLPPQSMRGKQNHPASIKIIAEYIAQLLNIPFESVAQVTTTHAHEIFRLSPSPTTS